VETNSNEFPDYRTDEKGENWENAMGESWETVYFYGDKNHNQLPELFQQYMKTVKPPTEERNLKKELLYQLTSVYGDEYIDFQMLINLLDEILERIEKLENEKM
jgi:hypothetical protein